jgi:selenocysteine lyase/cysteine desulfurase
MAAVGMEMMAAWGHAAIRERLAMLTHRLAEALGNIGDVRILDPNLRAPNILSLGFGGRGMPDKLTERLAAERVYVAPRLGRIRISPHVYNDEDDVERFTSVFRRLAL